MDNAHTYMGNSHAYMGNAHTYMDNSHTYVDNSYIIVMHVTLKLECAILTLIRVASHINMSILVLFIIVL